MKRSAFLILISFLVGLYARPVQAQLTNFRPLSVLTIEIAADQVQCIKQQPCPFTIKIANRGALLSGTLVFTDWHNDLIIQGVKLVSVSGPWNCENVAGPSGNNEAWKCANASVNLQKNHFLQLTITLEFPEDYEHQFAQNCVQISSGYIPKKSHFKASAADCATVTVANPFPSSFKAARARSGRLSFKDRKKRRKPWTGMRRQKIHRVP